jgi:hypothetical protein
LTRVAVFVDYQNVYMGARETFGHGRLPSYTFGQVDPLRLGALLTHRGRTIDADRELEAVRIFRGEPSPERNPVGHRACRRQVDRRNAEARVLCATRPLKYYRRGRGDDGRAAFGVQEKGIDVLLALAMVMGAKDDLFDVAVLCSTDTDMVPAVEAVHSFGKVCEVAAWESKASRRRRLALPDRNLWCHWLHREDYELVADPTDYTRPVGPTSPGP